MDACDITVRPPEPDMNPSDETIRKILSDAKTIAIIGLSNKPHRESYSVGRYLADNGYNVLPVHPNIKQWEGLNVYRSVCDIKEDVDIIDVFRKPDAIPGLVSEIVRKKPKAVWFQLGIVNNPSARMIRENGITVIQNKCIKIEHSKLL